MTVNGAPALHVLREGDLKKVLDVKAGIDIIERTFRDYGSGNTQRLSDPPSLYAGSGHADSGRVKVKGATLMTDRVTGIRMISDLPAEQGVSSYHLLCVFDDRTALPIGFIDETWLHRFRTALTGVVAARYLARKDSRTVALIGAGAIASQLFPALTDSFDLEEVRVVARRFERAQLFCDRFDGRLGPRFVPVRDSAAAIEGADIVITLTFADEPVVLPGMLSAGSFLCSMGETEEVAFGVLDEVDRFVVDEFDYATVLGDIAVWLKKGFARRDELENMVDAHIGEVIAGIRPARQTPEERIFAIIQGMAICDLALASYALQCAAEQGLGEQLTMFDWL
jgi:ornithine cyclodeaminase/alanine dehydrogenase-like protein (mu-crystallin family)